MDRKRHVHTSVYQCRDLPFICYLSLLLQVGRTTPHLLARVCAHHCMVGGGTGIQPHAPMCVRHPYPWPSAACVRLCSSPKQEGPFLPSLSVALSSACASALPPNRRVRFHALSRYSCAGDKYTGQAPSRPSLPHRSPRPRV